MSIGVKRLRALYNALDTVTNTTTETAHTGVVTLPAESVRKGLRIEGKAQVIAPTTNSTDTLTTKVYLGPASAPLTGILISDQTAIDVANNDVITHEFWCVVDATGTVSVATFSGGGVSYANGVTAVSKTRGFVRATDAQVSTFEDLVIAVSSTWSQVSTNDIARLATLDVTLTPALPSE
jgi:hypothetical protein